MSSNLAQIHVNVPDGMVAEVLQELNRLGGSVTGIKQEQGSRTGIDESIPRSSVAMFKIWLMEFSGGQGFISEV